jgi:DNA end-binding protein Ku
MSRAFWKGSISFGLVNIPVSLYPAEKSDDLSFHQLDRRDLNPIGYKRINKKTEEEVPWDRIVRGYQYEKGRYVVLTDQDLKRASVEKTQTIDIVGFCEASQISPLFFEKPYYLEPAKAGAKAYALLRETLRKTGMVGLASVVVRTRQHMAALMERRGALVLEILRWAHELRDTRGLEIPKEQARVSKQETDMAVRLVKGMTEKWDPKKFKDTYADDLMALIHRRIATGKTTEIDESEPKAPRTGKGEVVDLMPLLRKSLAHAHGRRRQAH